MLFCIDEVAFFLLRSLIEDYFATENTLYQ